MFPLKWALHHNVSQVASCFRGKHEDSTPDNQHIHQPQISVSSIDCKSRSNTRRSKDHSFKKPKPSTGFPFMIYFSFLWSQSCLEKALSGFLHCCSCLFLLLIIYLPGLFSHWPLKQVIFLFRLSSSIMKPTQSLECRKHNNTLFMLAWLLDQHILLTLEQHLFENFVLILSLHLNLTYP